MSQVFLYSKVKLHWGFIVRQLGASAAQLAYVLPPPPTIVGSFMNPLARILGLSETLDPKAGPAGSKVMNCALKATLSAAAGLDPCGNVGVAVYAEPSRITAGAYKTGGDYERALKQPPLLGY
jgi:CRISPR-associated protein Cas5a/b/c